MGGAAVRSVTIATSLVPRVQDTIRRHGMLRGGEAVLVAVSGGPDSVALLDVLCALRTSLRLTVTVAHVHHGLRPEADAEADAVAHLCEGLGVAVPGRARDRAPGAAVGRARGGEPAGAARGCPRPRRGAVGARRIATGHTADDQAETVLMRLLQGAGPRGLAGIAPVRGLLVSPLIETRRARSWLTSTREGSRAADDASNRDPRFLRSRIRHDLLPFMAELTGGSVVEALARAAGTARALLADLEERARADSSGTRWSAWRASSSTSPSWRPARGSWRWRSSVRPRRDSGRRGPSGPRRSAPSGACSARRPDAARSASGGSWSSGAAAGSGSVRARCPPSPRARGRRRGSSIYPRSASGWSRASCRAHRSTRCRGSRRARPSTPTRCPPCSRCGRADRATCSTRSAGRRCAGSSRSSSTRPCRGGVARGRPSWRWRATSCGWRGCDAAGGRR